MAAEAKSLGVRPIFIDPGTQDTGFAVFESLATDPSKAWPIQYGTLSGGSKRTWESIT